MDTVFHIAANEFDESLFERIQSFIKDRVNAEITISISEKQLENFITAETKEEYVKRLTKSIDDINAGKGITFTMQELKEFVDK